MDWLGKHLMLCLFRMPGRAEDRTWTRPDFINEPRFGLGLSAYQKSSRHSDSTRYKNRDITRARYKLYVSTMSELDL